MRAAQKGSGMGPGEVPGIGCPAGRAGAGLAWPSDSSGGLRRVGSRAPSGETWGLGVSFCPGGIATLRRRWAPRTLQGRLGGSPPGSRAGGAASPRGRGAERPAEPAGRLSGRRGEGRGPKPRPRGMPPVPAEAPQPPCGGPGAAAEAGAASPPPRPPRPAPAARRSGARLVRARDPRPRTARPGAAVWGEASPVLTEGAVLLQGPVDPAAGVDLEVVLGGTVELPAPGRSPEVLVDAAASPRIPARPGGARGGSGGLGHGRGPPRGARLLQQSQEQDPNYNHCGMMAAALSLLGRARLAASGTRGPIKAVLLAALRRCRARTASSRAALARFYQPRSGPFICLRFT